MNDALPGYEVTVYIVLGVAAACVLLYYLRAQKSEKKHKLLALGLFIASAIYVVFAIITFNEIWITVEIVGLLLFVLFVWMAFHYSMWFVVLGWALHIVWDVGVHPQETAPYVPFWYAWLCVGFDAVIALYLAVSLIRHEQKT